MKEQRSFADTMKRHLTAWAGELDGFRTDGAHSWVLHPSLGAMNYFGSQPWFALVADKPHLWCHALNSSQAFAVNLFGPARFSQAAAQALWKALPVARGHCDPQHVGVHFEYSGPAKGFASEALGETGIPTQIDVAVEGTFAHGVTRLQFIEVKLTEAHFGSCRGAKGGKRRANPAPERCGNLARVREDTPGQCWLVQAEHRKYWDLIEGNTGLEVSADAEGGCPWRGGLYQLMRNWALARSLLDRDLATSIELAVCVHPDNDVARRLHKAIAGSCDAVKAFNVMAAPMRVVELDPRKLIAAQDVEGAPSGWRAYMERRYALAASG